MIAEANPVNKEIFNLKKLPDFDTEALSKIYRGANPYPHIILDDVFSPETLDGLIAEFDQYRGDIENQTYNTFMKTRQSDIDRLGPLTQNFIEMLQRPKFLKFLEEITGIKGLLPDPFLIGAGTHEIGRGGFLKVHTDFNWHKGLKLHRRLNILIYLNHGWAPEWKGDLELWDNKLKGCVARISPIFNRMVVFSTTDKSYHGHPDPLECPDGVSRRSIALYYYTSDRPSSESKFGKSSMTNWRERPGEKFSVNRLRYAGAQALLRVPLLRKLVQQYALKK